MRPPFAAALTAPPPPAVAAALAAHNAARAEHGARPLEWDAALAAGAEALAAGCPASPLAAAGREGARAYGVSFARGAKDVAAAVSVWFGEGAAYDFARPGWTPAAAGFTQLVWRATSRVGCAAALACSGGGLVVCRYAEPGNVVGADDWDEQVTPAGTAAAAPLQPQPLQAAPVTAAAALAPAYSIRPPADDAPAVADAVLAQSAPSAEAAEGVLARANEFRQLHQAPPLVWDDDLAASAAAFAADCAPGGRSERAGRVHGESVARGVPALAAAVDKWYAEVRARARAARRALGRCGRRAAAPLLRPACPPRALAAGPMMTPHTPTPAASAARAPLHSSPSTTSPPPAGPSPRATSRSSCGAARGASAARSTAAARCPSRCASTAGPATWSAPTGRSRRAPGC